MNAQDDVNLLLGEAQRICSSLDGKVRADQLRQQFLNERIRKHPAARGANQAFQRAVERAKEQHRLSEADDGHYRLPTGS